MLSEIDFCGNFRKICEIVHADYAKNGEKRVKIMLFYLKILEKIYFNQLIISKIIKKCRKK